MIRLSALLLLAAAMLAACEPTVSNAPGVYRIRAGDTAEIQNRVLDSVNALRQGAGVQPLQLNAALNSAASTHAADMSRQQRAWPFGSDSSSPYERVLRAGYTGDLVGELYSQSFETELETLTAWIDDGTWGDELLDPDATEMGFGWHQDSTGLIWWVLNLGDSTRRGYVAGPV